MRDLAAYQDAYQRLPFEATQARYRKREILESLERHAPRTLLEVGCGVDPIFQHFSASRLTAVVEPAREFFQNACAMARGRSDVVIVEGTLEDAVERLVRERWDFILVSSLLHEVEDPLAVLAACRRLCAPDTIVHIVVPNARSFHRLLAMEMSLIRTLHERSAIQKQMQQQRTFDRDTLAELVVSAGFEVVEAGTFFVKPFTHVQMAALQDSGVVTEAMLDGLYRLSRHFPENGSELFMSVRSSDSQ